MRVSQYVSSILSLALIVTQLTLTSCSYETPEAENPVPGLENPNTISVIKDGVLSIRKDFFGIEINQETNTVKNVGKRWLCGWASVVQSGYWKNLRSFNATPMTGHCNMEFQISADGKRLEAREVNVDIDDFDQWPLLFTIGINKHYFYEKQTDNRGRAVNKWAKVSNRKNWLQQPIMDLDLGGIAVLDKKRSPHRWRSVNFHGLSDVEVAKHKGNSYLGFNVLVTSSWWGSNIQDKVRFNFLEFQGTPGFKKTDYDISVASHMNILHILGQKPDGVRETKYAAHWSLKKPIEICLNGFPKDGRGYDKIGHEVIKEVNEALQESKIVAKDYNAFVISEKQPKYNFDLRCPSITWIDDAELSMGAPLGIGLTNTDVRTGEIMWGGAVIWGGMVDYLVNRDSESAVDSLIATTHELYSKMDSAKDMPEMEDIYSQLNLKGYHKNFRGMDQIPNFHRTSDTGIFTDIHERVVSRHKRNIERLSETLSSSSLSASETENIGVQLQKNQRAIKFISNFKDLPALESMSQKVGEYFQKDLLREFRDMSAGDAQNYVESLIAKTGFAKKMNFSEEEKASKATITSDSHTMLNSPEGLRVLRAEFSRHQGAAIDAQNTFGKNYRSWLAALSQGPGQERGPILERVSIARSLIKRTMLHEMGHVLGLGHQFEANVLPQPGEVPPTFYGKKYLDKLVDDSKNFLNSTSIMDYPSGLTKVSTPESQVKMEIQDKLVLKYLYQQKYAGYAVGDSDFTFFDVEDNGVVLNNVSKNGKLYKTTYMPQCSDIDAWLGVSPYCRRWDRGYDAPTMVQENYRYFNDTFLARMNSFTQASGGNTWWATYRLWYSTYELVNNNRTFYDKLRYQLKTDPVFSSAFNVIKEDSNALLQFSSSCIDPSTASERYRIPYAKLALQPSGGEKIKFSLDSDHQDSQYRDLLEKYIQVIGNAVIDSASIAEFRSIESKMRKNGVEFTELQKLCRASKASLNTMVTLLTLEGRDFPLINYDHAISPTGLRGGNATQDFTKLFGRYEQLGTLPIKLAALDILTQPASTFRWGWWRVPKLQYSDPNIGKTGYFTLYPKLFTDIVRQSADNNMVFGDTRLNGTASLSISSLFMSMFLDRAFNYGSNEGSHGINPDYLDNIKAQTDFDVRYVPILLTGNQPGKKKNKIFGFKGQVFNIAKYELNDIPEVYVLPEGRVIARGQANQILLPVTKIRFIGKVQAYVWALEVTFDNSGEENDFKGETVKNTITDKANNELSKCMSGSSGLKKFFSGDEKFEGFDTDDTIADSDETYKNFAKSVRAAFEVYDKEENPSQHHCASSRRGIGLVTATALSYRGWILPQVIDYIRK